MLRLSARGASRQIGRYGRARHEGTADAAATKIMATNNSPRPRKTAAKK